MEKEGKIIQPSFVIFFILIFCYFFKFYFKSIQLILVYSYVDKNNLGNTICKIYTETSYKKHLDTIQIQPE